MTCLVDFSQFWRVWRPNSTKKLSKYFILMVKNFKTRLSENIWRGILPWKPILTTKNKHSRVVLPLWPNFSENRKNTHFNNVSHTFKWLSSVHVCCQWSSFPTNFKCCRSGLCFSMLATAVVNIAFCSFCNYFCNLQGLLMLFTVLLLWLSPYLLMLQPQILLFMLFDATVYYIFLFIQYVRK